MYRAFEVTRRPGPLIAVALHAGHEVGPLVQRLVALAEDTRLREEDPATEAIADFGATLVVVRTSRFEVDLNRPRSSAVYRCAEDAWGLDVWAGDVPDQVVADSLATYDAFHAAMRELIAETVAREGMAVVFDIHSYNHRRDGADGPAAPGLENPEVNLGTGSLAREWRPCAKAFLGAMREAGYDARENVKFRGGAFSAWVNEHFPGRACALAVEFKKTYMDEWTGEIDADAVSRARDALGRAAGSVLDAARRVVA